MPSLGIAPHLEGCIDPQSISTQDAAPVTGVFPVDGTLHLLEIRIQAIKLSPYRTGPAAPRFIRLNTIAAFLTC
ncbi:MAG: hypothetical protein LC776_05970, partial [Acidobacteria bacterium]|nr:hypothetical protein [Acidobacteriota bacterium]